MYPCVCDLVCCMCMCVCAHCVRASICLWLGVVHFIRGLSFIVQSNRVTLKMEVSHMEHSHIIGKGGANVKKGI